jgi:hypothetical protein
MIYIAWATVLSVVGIWLYLSAASMLGTFLKQRREADEQEARRIRWRDALKDSEDTYGHAPQGDFKAVLRSRAEDAQ